MRKVLIVLCVISVVALTGCVTSGIDEDFVVGSRAAYERIADRYTAYVEADERLDESLRDSRLEPMKEWLRLIEQGERSIGED